MSQNEELSGNYDPEKSSAPQNFVLRCARCRWARMSSGLGVDLKDLLEIKPNCANCGKFKKYKCPKCGMACPLKRVKGNT